MELHIRQLSDTENATLFSLKNAFAVSFHYRFICFGKSLKRIYLKNKLNNASTYKSTICNYSLFSKSRLLLQKLYIYTFRDGIEYETLSDIALEKS